MPTSTATPSTALDLRAPELYLNRELSLLEFNRRVLAQAEDEDTPLMERLRFLCISSTNLDEFFEIRVAGLKQRLVTGYPDSAPDQRTPQELLAEISRCAHGLVESQYRVLNDVLFPALEDQGYHFLRRSSWSEEERDWLRHYFEDQVLPLLSPMGLDPAHPFPRVLNKSLSFVVSLEGRDAFGRNKALAIVQAPRALPRIIQLPREAGESYRCVFLSSVIHAFVDKLFPGMHASGCYQFRVTRNSDLFVDEEEMVDLMEAVEGELSSRRWGDCVRLEVAHNCPDDMCRFLLEQFDLGEEDLYQVNGPVNLNRMAAVCDMADRAELVFAPYTPRRPAALPAGKRIMDVLRKRDVLLHHPFESFVPVVELIRQAAEDPQVLVIKQTLYRTGPDSTIVLALCAAARAGKEVTVVIELRARFDEEANIVLANRLQEAGAHVLYGVVGYKTHAKMILVVRREAQGELRNYVHLGTGNYHPRTARLYTDYGLMTADPEVGRDVHRMFLQLTGLGKLSKLTRLLQSPFDLLNSLLAMIEGEAVHARAGRDARIIAKMNSLVDPEIIAALYAASQAGVRIDLIVRGMCALRPGVQGVSERIQVRSIVGRFLEHTRVFYFHNDGSSKIFCASADWMERNLRRRVEACFPILENPWKTQVLQELELYLSDNKQAWLLSSDGSYHRAMPAADEPPRVAQLTLMEAG